MISVRDHGERRESTIRWVMVSVCRQAEDESLGKVFSVIKCGEKTTCEE